MTALAVATSTLGEHAAAYGRAGWKIIPLRGKAPAIPTVHPVGDPLRGVCHGECGAQGHGVYDATDDPGTILEWWSRWPTANIGGRVPAGCVVIDVDPRSGGDDAWLALERSHGP